MYPKKRKRKEKIQNILYIPQNISTLPLKKWSYTNSPPKNDYSHIQNYSHFLSRVTKGKSVKQTSHRQSQHLHQHHLKHHRHHHHPHPHPQNQKPRKKVVKEQPQEQNHPWTLVVMQYDRHKRSPDTTPQRMYLGEHPCAAAAP